MIYLSLNKHLTKRQHKGRCSEACPDSSAFVMLEANTQKSSLYSSCSLRGSSAHPRLSHYKVTLLYRWQNSWTCVGHVVGHVLGHMALALWDALCPWALWRAHMLCLLPHLQDLAWKSLHQSVRDPVCCFSALYLSWVVKVSLVWCWIRRRWLSFASKIAYFTERVEVTVSRQWGK